MSASGKDKSGILSICRRAGKLRCGMDIVKGGCENSEVKAVFVSSDLSPKSLKEIAYCCNVNGKPIYRLEMTMDQIAAAIGRRTGILGADDSGFAKAIAKGTQELDANKAV